MIVDAPDYADLYCDACQATHNFVLVNKHYRSTVEQLIPESLLHWANRCNKRIYVLNLTVVYSSQKVHGVHELMLPRG